MVQNYYSKGNEVLNYSILLFCRSEFKDFWKIQRGSLSIRKEANKPRGIDIDQISRLHENIFEK